MNNMPWFGVPSSTQLTIKEQLQQTQEGIEYLENWKKMLAEKDKKHHQHERKGRGFSGSDVTALSLLLLFTSPWTGVYVIHAMAWAAAQYASAFAAFPK